MIEIHKMGFDSIPIVEQLYTIIFPERSKGVFLLDQPHYAVWLAYSGQVPVGFILIRHIFDEAEIIDIGVIPNYRRQGVAITILQKVLSALKAAEIKKIFLEVDITNQPALQLYKRFGFEVMSYRKAYYYIAPQMFHDAVNMCLNIKK